MTTAGIFFVRVLGAGLAFASTLLVTRFFGASGAGTYFLALAIATVCATLAQLGIDIPLMRMISVARERADWSSAHALFRRGLSLGSVAALLIGVFVFLASGLAGQIFGDEDLPHLLRVMATAILPFTVVLLVVRALIAIGRPLVADSLNRVGFNLGFIALILVLNDQFEEVAPAVAFTSSHWLVLGIGWLLWRQFTPSDRKPKKMAALTLLKPGLPILLATLFQILVHWSDTLMIGYFLTSDQVGIYGAAVRVSTVMSLVLGAAVAVYGPQFAALYQKRNLSQLGQQVRRFTVGSTILVSPILIGFLIFAIPLMMLFGQEFSDGHQTLRILAVGQFINVAAGIGGLLLAMSGFESRLLQVAIASATVNIALNLVLIPQIGIEGAAIATTVSFLLTNALNAYIVRRDIGVTIAGSIVSTIP